MRLYGKLKGSKYKQREEKERAFKTGKPSNYCIIHTGIASDGPQNSNQENCNVTQT